MEQRKGLLPGLGNGMPSDPVQGTPGQADPAPNVTPEEQAMYETFVDNARQLIFGKETMPAILDGMKADPEPVRALAEPVVHITMRLQKSAMQAGQPLDDAILLNGGEAIMADLAEMSAAAGIHEYTPDELEQAAYLSMDMYGDLALKEGLIDQEGMKGSYQEMVAANDQGTLGQLIPGLDGIQKDKGPAPPQQQDQMQRSPAPGSMKKGLM